MKLWCALDVKKIVNLTARILCCRHLWLHLEVGWNACKEHVKCEQPAGLLVALWTKVLSRDSGQFNLAILTTNPNSEFSGVLILYNRILCSRLNCFKNYQSMRTTSCTYFIAIKHQSVQTPPRPDQTRPDQT